MESKRDHVTRRDDHHLYWQIMGFYRVLSIKKILALLNISTIKLKLSSSSVKEKFGSHIFKKNDEQKMKPISANFGLTELRRKLILGRKSVII